MAGPGEGRGEALGNRKRWVGGAERMDGAPGGGTGGGPGIDKAAGQEKASKHKDMH